MLSCNVWQDNEPNVQTVHLHRATNLGGGKSRLLLTICSAYSYHNTMSGSSLAFTSLLLRPIIPAATKITCLAAACHRHQGCYVVTYWCILVTHSWLGRRDTAHCRLLQVRKRQFICCPDILHMRFVYLPVNRLLSSAHICCHLMLKIVNTIISWTRWWNRWNEKTQWCGLL